MCVYVCVHIPLFLLVFIPSCIATASTLSSLARLCFSWESNPRPPFARRPIISPAPARPVPVISLEPKNLSCTHSGRRHGFQGIFSSQLELCSGQSRELYSRRNQGKPGEAVLALPLQQRSLSLFFSLSLSLSFFLRRRSFSLSLCFDCFRNSIPFHSIPFLSVALPCVALRCVASLRSPRSFPACGFARAWPAALMVSSLGCSLPTWTP